MVPIIMDPSRSDQQEELLFDTDVIRMMEYSLSHLRLDACDTAFGRWQEMSSLNYAERVLRSGTYIPVIKVTVPPIRRGTIVPLPQ